MQSSFLSTVEKKIQNVLLLTHLTPQSTVLGSRLHMYILTHPNTRRIQMLRTFWIDECLKQYPNTVFLVDGPVGTGIANLPISPEMKKLPINRTDQSGSMYRAFGTALQHYAANKDSPPWMYRGTDDSFLNITMINEYIEELEKKYNPLIDKVMFGNCVIVKGTIFLQGGSGYLMSRAAAVYFNQVYPDLTKEMDSVYEDVLSNHLVKMIGMTMEEASSPRFTGHSYRGFNVNHFPKCENFMNGTGCRDFHFPANKIAVVHQRYLSDSQLMILPSQIWKFPDYVMAHKYPSFDLQKYLCVE